METVLESPGKDFATIISSLVHLVLRALLQVVSWTCQLDLSAGSQDVELSRSTPVSGHVSSQLNAAESSRSSARLVSVSTDCDAFIVNTVLSFVKAYRLKGDKYSLKI